METVKVIDENTGEEREVVLRTDQDSRADKLGWKSGDIFSIYNNQWMVFGLSRFDSDAVFRMQHDDGSWNPGFTCIYSSTRDQIGETAYIHLKCLQFEPTMPERVLNLPPAPDGWTWTEYRMVRLHEERFSTGGWTPLPQGVLDAMEEVGFVLNPRHFVHLSTEEIKIIAFTNDGDMERDRQTPMKIGKYVKKCMPSLDAPSVAKISNALNIYFDNLYKFGIARTQEDIADVYIYGPRSCMSGSPDRESYEHNEEFCSFPHHPAEVYATEDCGVAYAYDSQRDKYVARAIVNVKSKEYVRIYGNEDLLYQYLRDEGYSQNYSALDECRLLQLANTDGDTVMPYLDGIQNVDEDGEDYWIVSEDGEFCAEYTDGLLHDNRMNCGDCGDRIGRHQTYYWSSYHDIYIGRCCIDSYVEVRSSTYGRDWISKDVVELYAGKEFFEHDGEWYYKNSLRYFDLIIHEGEVITESEYEELTKSA